MFTCFRNKKIRNLKFIYVKLYFKQGKGGFRILHRVMKNNSCSGFLLIVLCSAQRQIKFEKLHCSVLAVPVWKRKSLTLFPEVSRCTEMSWHFMQVEL